MANSVYHFHFPNETLPNSKEDRAAFAKENTAKLTGGAENEVVFYIQPHIHQPTCRLTISVPETLTQAHEALRAAGAAPAFQEPENPYWDDNTLVLPGSFQVLKFGGWLDPRSVENNPTRMINVAEEAGRAIGNLPMEARDILNWGEMDADEVNGTFTVTMIGI